MMNTQTKRIKAKIVVVVREVRNNLKIEEIPLYVGYTERSLDAYFSGFKSDLKNHSPTISHKLQQITDVYLGSLKIKQVSSCFLDEADKVVDKYIQRYNTIENGWNTVYRS